MESIELLLNCLEWALNAFYNKRNRDPLIAFLVACWLRAFSYTLLYFILLSREWQRKQTDRQTDRWTDKQKDRQIDRLDRHVDWQTWSQTDTLFGRPGNYIWIITLVCKQLSFQMCTSGQELKQNDLIETTAILVACCIIFVYQNIIKFTT